MAENLRKACVLIPLTSTGAESTLYKTLLNRLKERPLVNYFYALALQPDVISYMEGKGYSLVDGEVRAEDFFREFDIDNVISKHATQKGMAELNVGAVDASHNTIEYTDALEALNKVTAFNENNRLFVASVVKRGDKYIIKVYEKNATNQLQAGSQALEKSLWNTIDTVFQKHGMNLTALSKEVPYIINPIEAHKIPQVLQHISTTNALRHLTTSDIHLLLKLGENSVQVNRLMHKAGGDLTKTATYIYDALQRPSLVTPDTMTLIEATIEALRKFRGLDTTALYNQIQSESLNFMGNSEEYSIQDTLTDLRTKYSEINDELVDITNGIKSVREAAGAALLALQRERNAKERQKGITKESLEIDKIEDALGKAIRTKEYYVGLLDYIMRGEEVSKEIDNIIAHMPTSGDVFTRSRDIANDIIVIDNMLDEYMDVLQALSIKGSDGILTDSGMSEVEQEDLQERSSAILTSFNAKKRALMELKKKVMYDMANEILGKAGMPQGAIDTLVNEAASETSLQDILYSAGRQSNALIGVMGSIIRDAQDKRDRKLNPIIKEIDSATAKLKKTTGSINSSFMYDKSDGNRFLNPYNWELFYSAQAAARKSLEKSYKGAALAEQMQLWINDNTEAVVVDNESGRTERMPMLSKFAKYKFANGFNKTHIDDYYRRATGKQQGKASNTWIAEHLSELSNAGIIQIYNPIDNLTAPQKEYYDRMMAIKGKLGTMLPYYAQNYYLAPQVTKGVQDSLAEGKVGEGIKNWLQDTFTINDKDHELNRDYFELGEEKSAVARGDMKGRAKKYIPIYYATPLRSADAGNLLLDASTGMAHLAGVAVGYDCISEVEALCNVLGDYITGAADTVKTVTGDNVVDGAHSDKSTVFQKLINKWGNADTRSIVEGIIDQHIYGYTIREKDAKFLQGKLAKGVKLALAYSSIYNLTTNVKGAVSNLLVGEFQMLMDAIAGSAVKRTGSAAEFYTLRDYMWAHDIMFKKGSPTLIDFLSNNVNSYNGLLAELFDPTMDNYSEKARKHYRNKGGNFIDKDWKFIGYGAGEHLIHYCNMLSILHNRQVLVNGEQKSLYDAFEIQENADGIKHLEIKRNTTTLDGQVVDADYVNKVRGLIREANQNMHGSMNSEDQGIIKQRLLGRCAMHLRTWMVEHYSRRYRTEHFSAATKDLREGYWYTLGRCIKEMCKYRRAVSAQWSTLNAHQKQNVMRSLTEISALLTGIFMSWGGVLDPDEYDDWLSRFTVYQAKRLLMDEKASTPFGLTSEGIQMARNLFPILTTVSKSLYLINGLENGDFLETMKSGKGKGQNKYWYNVKKRVLPFYHQIDQLLDLEDEDSMFTIFQMQYSM